MAKLTDEQRKQLEDLQALADAPDDDADEYEVWIKNGDKEARVPSRRAGGYLKEHFGISLYDDPAPAGDDDPDGDDEPPKDPKPAGGGYFSKRKG